MGVSLRKDSIDLGIVITDSERSLGFYRDLLGFTHEGDIPMPIGDGGTMHRLWCGTTLVKLVKFDRVPPPAAPGGITGATGYRYFTLQVDNLEEITEQLLVPLGIPLVRGLMIGHIEDKATVPLGIEAELDADAGTLTLLEPAVT